MQLSAASFKSFDYQRISTLRIHENHRRLSEFRRSDFTWGSNGIAVPVHGMLVWGPNPAMTSSMNSSPPGGDYYPATFYFKRNAAMKLISR